MVSEQFTVGHATFELQLVSPRNRRSPGAPIDVSSPAKSAGRVVRYLTSLRFAPCPLALRLLNLWTFTH